MTSQNNIKHPTYGSTPTQVSVVRRRCHGPLQLVHFHQHRHYHLAVVAAAAVVAAVAAVPVAPVVCSCSCDGPAPPSTLLLPVHRPALSSKLVLLTWCSQSKSRQRLSLSSVASICLRVVRGVVGGAGADRFRG